LDAGCTIYDSSLLLDGGDSVAPGGGVGFWSSNDGHGGKCFTAGAPTPSERPAPSDAPPLPPIYLAIHDVQLGALDKDGKPNANAWKDFGFDLDNTCTCIDPNAVEQCKRPLAADPDTCDLAGGRDATGNRALQLIASAVPKISDQTLSQQIQAGHFGALVSLRKYNGALNDSRVQVDIVPSYGTVTVNAGVPLVNGKGILVNPAVAHDGNECIAVDRPLGTANRHGHQRRKWQQTQDFPCMHT
jgi:hypothetical protein